MGDVLRNAIVEGGRRGHAIGAAALLDRVEAELNEEGASLRAVSSARSSVWSRVPGPVVALGTGVLLILFIIGSLWIVRDGTPVEQTPVTEPIELTTTVPTVPPTTVPPVEAEAPWITDGEVRIESTVLTVNSFSIEGGTATLRYELATLAPEPARLMDGGTTPPPAVLPDRWELETSTGVIDGSSFPGGTSVRFEVGDGFNTGDITELRLVSWRTLVPVTYDFEMPVESGTTALMPDGATIELYAMTDMESGRLLSFDAKAPVDLWSPLPCFGLGGRNNNCFEPTATSGWLPRETDGDLKALSLVDDGPSVIELRYSRPMWAPTEASIRVPITPPGGVTADPVPFPAGFTPVSDGEAVKPNRIVQYGDQLLVSMTSVVRRGLDPAEVEPLIGGRWILKTASGGTVESIGMTFDDHIPGAFAVVFPVPAEGNVDPSHMQLVETWQPVPASGETDAGPIQGIPWHLDPPADINLSSGMTVRVDQFDLEGVGGAGRWAVASEVRQPAIVAATGVIVDSSGETVGATADWFAPARHFGLSNTQRLFWFWLEASDPDEELSDDVLSQGDHVVVLRVDANVPQPLGADVSVDLVGVPVE
jgi:hypothetical protein